MKNSRNANSIETSSNAQLIKVQWDANTLVIFCELCITKEEAGCQLILGMAKSSTGLGPHGAPSQMRNFFNNFWGMGWGEGEK